MKSHALIAASFVIAIAGSATGAETNPVDSLTKLPLPATGGPFLLLDEPEKIDDVPVCKSKGTMNMYTGRSGNVSAAVSWYSTHLVGFKHVHGIGSGRSQDTFFNPTGTLIVGITGKPGPDGQDPQVASVIYGTIQPGVDEKVISGMNVQHVVCP